MNIGIFSITAILDRENGNMSDLEDETNSFLTSIRNHVPFEIKWYGDDLTCYGECSLNVVFVRTGGTESIFRELYLKYPDVPFYLLAWGKYNSLGAATEILAFLRGEGCQGEILHGSTEYIYNRLTTLVKVRYAISSLKGKTYGVIGAPSDWLISSRADFGVYKKCLGIKIKEIPLEELYKEIEQKEYPPEVRMEIKIDYDQDVLTGSLEIYGALKRIAQRYKLEGLAVRCYDVLHRYNNTCCLAMSILNSEGTVATCEGDIPAMVSMIIARALTRQAAFLANTSVIDLKRNHAVFSHCSVPLSMVKDYRYETHFESGTGLALHGVLPRGAATIFKCSGDMSEFCASDGELINNLNNPNMCRTQITVQPVKDVSYFLKRAIGNHHVILLGHYADMITEFIATLECNTQLVE